MLNDKSLRIDEMAHNSAVHKIDLLKEWTSVPPSQGGNQKYIDPSLKHFCGRWDFLPSLLVSFFSLSEIEILIHMKTIADLVSASNNTQLRVNLIPLPSSPYHYVVVGLSCAPVI